MRALSFLVSSCAPALVLLALLGCEDGGKVRDATAGGTAAAGGRAAATAGGVGGSSGRAGSAGSTGVGGLSGSGGGGGAGGGQDGPAGPVVMSDTDWEDYLIQNTCPTSPWDDPLSCSDSRDLRIGEPIHSQHRYLHQVNFVTAYSFPRARAGSGTMVWNLVSDVQ